MDRTVGDPDVPSLPRSTKLRRCPQVQTNVNWPVPVDQRLNELLRQLDEALGGETSRSQLLAALVATAPADARQLEEILRRYWRLTAGATVLQRTGPIAIPARRPGRRPRGS